MRHRQHLHDQSESPLLQAAVRGVSPRTVDYAKLLTPKQDWKWNRFLRRRRGIDPDAVSGQQEKPWNGAQSLQVVINAIGIGDTCLRSGMVSAIFFTTIFALPPLCLAMIGVATMVTMVLFAGAMAFLSFLQAYSVWTYVRRGLKYSFTQPAYINRVTPYGY
ncbi:MAG: hypothetical protein BYD32DRAFT_455384 [Podila humilis]|nr:MAG: hypothetical protein BYD32DRAFT_455384 [Podila humilis]